MTDDIRERIREERLAHEGAHYERLSIKPRLSTDPFKEGYITAKKQATEIVLDWVRRAKAMSLEPTVRATLIVNLDRLAMRIDDMRVVDEEEED